MKAKRRTFLAAAVLAGVALLCVVSAVKDASPTPSALNTNDTVKVDFDFTRMNATMRTTYMYRLAAIPGEFEGKTLRVSGTFLTRVDEQDGKRYFGCLIGDPSGCSCCSPGGVLEFVPKGTYVWPTNFPPVQSRIAVTGRLKMFDVGQPGRQFAIPRLVEADMSAFR